MYAILDIETTGGKFNEEGITEIAIYQFDGQSVTDQFISLVNPEQPIQEYVVKLTGISNKMLRNAPKFHEVAKRIIEITEDCILVAHNASFDYRMLQLEFGRLGYEFKKDSICTVDLSQTLLPEAPSYKLGKLVKSLGIPLSDRHRANGDALATVQLFKLLLTKDIEKTIIQKSILYHDNRSTKEKLNKLIEEVPSELGVFYLLDANQKVIYIGKGKNMKQELTGVFLKSSKRGQKIQKYSDSIRYELAGNALFLRLKYYLELDQISPKYNFKKQFKPKLHSFNNSDFILYEKGREIEEQAIILVENHEVRYFGYTNLAYQEQSLVRLKKILSPIENTTISNVLVKDYLLKTNRVKLERFTP